MPNRATNRFALEQERANSYKKVREKSAEEFTWPEEAGLNINMEKTSIIKFSRQEEDMLTTYQINGNDIAQVDKASYLGITLDCKLNLHEHIIVVANRGRNHVLGIQRLARYISAIGI